MIKIFVDSGSSIKQAEKEKLGVEILPLKILLKDVEYSDGVDLSREVFYDTLIKDGVFPKTSLPSPDLIQELVEKEKERGNEVLIITISSGISGTYSAIKSMFSNDEKVRVVDSKTAVGGIRILVMEARKYLDRSLDFVEEKLQNLIPRIRALAVPETLDYLHKGGRLSRASWAVGTLLKIKPIVELKDKVGVAHKAIGLKSAMKQLLLALNHADLDYPIVPSYTYENDNLNALVEKAEDKYKKVMTKQDDLDHAIACHWGPRAFGFVFVEKN
ncbi:MAG: DegV family protein [Clostridia bacterium]|nr:DegV family protein [Clostridia bacterium]